MTYHGQEEDHEEYFQGFIKCFCCVMLIEKKLFHIVT